MDDKMGIPMSPALPDILEKACFSGGVGKVQLPDPLRPAVPDGGPMDPHDPFNPVGHGGHTTLKP